VKLYKIELKAAYTHISKAKWAGTSADRNLVPSKIAKPGRPKTAYWIEVERLYKSLQKDVTEAPVQPTERQETKWGRFKVSRFLVPYTVRVTGNLFNRDA